MDKLIVNKYFDMIAGKEIKIELTEEDIIFFKNHNLSLYVNSLAKLNLPYTRDEQSKKALVGEIGYEILCFELESIARCFDQGDVDYRLLKGVALACTYPYPYTRIMGDFDIIVRPKDMEKALDLLVKLGYTQGHHDFNMKDIPFFKVGAPNVELHQMLFDPSDTLKIDRVNLDIWMSEELIIVNDYPVKSPTPIHQLRFILLHYLKHFRGSGSGMRFPLDLYWFTQYHKLDLSVLYEVEDKTDVLSFIDMNILFLNGYFGTNYTLREDYKDNHKIDLIEIADYIASYGVFGKDDKIYEINSRIIHYKKAFQNSFLVWIRTVFFPAKEQLDNRFEYAKESSLLLPVAWIHRFLSFVLGKRPLNEKLFFLTRNKETVSRKDKLLKDLNLY